MPHIFGYALQSSKNVSFSLQYLLLVDVNVDQRGQNAPCSSDAPLPSHQGTYNFAQRAPKTFHQIYILYIFREHPGPALKSVQSKSELVQLSYQWRFGYNPTLAEMGGVEGGEGGGGMDGAGSRNRMSRTNSLYLSTGAPDKQKTVLLFHNKKSREFPSVIPHVKYWLLKIIISLLCLFLSKKYKFWDSDCRKGCCSRDIYMQRRG